MNSNPVTSPNMKLEVVLLPVADVERTKAFYDVLVAGAPETPRL